MTKNNYSAINDPVFIIYRSPFGALAMTDKLRRETIYERVMRDAQWKNLAVAALTLVTTAAACALCVLAEWYR